MCDFVFSGCASCRLTLIVLLFKPNMKKMNMTKRIMQENKRYKRALEHFKASEIMFVPNS